MPITGTWTLSIFFFLFLYLTPFTAGAQVKSFFIDPDHPQVIKKTQVPFVSEVILSTQDLPVVSSQHEAVQFDNRKFSHISLSPDRQSLAFCVDGVQHDWSGVLHLQDNRIEELGLNFEGEVLDVFWSGDGRFLVLEENQGNHRQFLEIFDREQLSHCRLDGRQVKNKFFNLSKPWWGPDGEHLYFKVDYNNVYRKSLGLKPKKFGSRIGEANPQCEKISFFSVSDFMKKFPQQVRTMGFSLNESAPQGEKP